MMKLIGIAGKAGSGKDTAADYICRKYPYLRYSLADPIRAALNAIFGFDASQWRDREWKETIIPELGVSPRHLAQTLGTEWGRECVHGDMWIMLAEQFMRRIQGQKTYVDGEYEPIPVKGVVVPDIRFQNEAQFIWAHHGHVILLDREVEAVEEHVSENGFEQLSFGTTEVNNNGSLEQLYAQLDKVMHNVL